MNNKDYYIGLKPYRASNIHNSEDVNRVEKLSDHAVGSSLKWYNHATAFFLLLFVLHVNHTCFSALNRCLAGIDSLSYYLICMLHVLTFQGCFYCSETAPHLYYMREGKPRAPHAVYSFNKSFITIWQWFFVLPAFRMFFFTIS